MTEADGMTPVAEADSGLQPDMDEQSGDLRAPDGVQSYSTRQIRRVRELLAKFSSVRRLSHFYPPEHPAVAESVGTLMREIAAYHAEGSDVQLAFFGGEVYFGEQVLTEESILFDQLVRDVESAGMGTMVFRQGLDAAELTRAMPLLVADSTDLDLAGGIEALRGALDTPHLFVGGVHALDATLDTVEGASEDSRGAYANAVTLVHEIDRLIRSNRAIGGSKVKGVARSLVDNVLENPEAMLQLTGLKNYDEYTFYHSANVAILSIALASRVTNDYRFLTSLGIGSLLHDIGKLAVDSEVLNKPGTLTPAEWEVVRQHPLRGAEIVATMPGVDRSAIVAVLEHHMRYDSKGYPQRRTPRPQHLASRIVAIADAYDAMTSRRSYSAARVQDEAVALLADGAGSSLDPTLVRMFIRLIGIYPPRSVVRLSTGEVAIVLSPGPIDPLRPVVRIIADSSGTITDPRDADLALLEDISIASCIDARTLNIEVEEYL